MSDGGIEDNTDISMDECGLLNKEEGQ